MGGFFFQGGRVSLAGCQRKEGRVCGPLRVTNVATPVKVEEQSAEVGHFNPFRCLHFYHTKLSVKMRSEYNVGV